MSATASSNSRRTSRNRRAGARSGFTLLEVLVVLVIVGLVSAMLFEALVRLNDVRGRLGPFLSMSEREGLMNGWFRNAVNGLVPDKLLGPHAFAGDARHFSGLTLAPFDDDPGGPTPCKWELIYDVNNDRTTLHYTGYDDKVEELRSWRGSKIEFAYLKPDLTWSDAWPPGFQHAKELPMAIRLYSADEGTVVVASIRGEKDPPPDVIKLLTGQ
jgi:general secretion pathway protein J